MSVERISPEELTQHIADMIPMARAAVREVGEDEIDYTQGVAVAADPAAPDEIPAHLLEVPGLVGHITRWITKSARYPQPLLSLGAALALVGTAAGQKYAGPTKSGTHLYALGLAATGAGKNHPAKMAKRLMRAADMADWIGPGQFMSEPAVYEIVAGKPILLCFMDEFGSYLQRINSPKGASGYEKAISGALRAMWGASFDIVQPPAWAKSSGRELKPIISPALSIYGMSVHEEFYAALQSNDIANGFLNRFLILSTQTKPEEVDPELDEDVMPDALVNRLKAIAARGGYGGSLRAGQQVDSWTAEIKLDWACAEARLAYTTFRKTIQERDSEDAKLLSRVPEMAVRLATIRAIGKDKAIQGPAVTMDDIAWGCELAMWSANRMIDDARSYMVESEHQGRANEVLRYIKKAGRLTLTELSRKVKHKYDARVLRMILDGLRDADQVTIDRVKGEGACKPTDIITYRG